MHRLSSDVLAHLSEQVLIADSGSLRTDVLVLLRQAYLGTPYRQGRIEGVCYNDRGSCLFPPPEEDQQMSTELN